MPKKIYVFESHAGLRSAWCTALRTSSFHCDVQEFSVVDSLASVFAVALPDLLLFGCEGAGLSRIDVLQWIEKCASLSVPLLLGSVDDEWRSRMPQGQDCYFFSKADTAANFLAEAERALGG
jgi:hypothetical protein